MSELTETERDEAKQAYEKLANALKPLTQLGMQPKDVAKIAGAIMDTCADVAAVAAKHAVETAVRVMGEERGDDTTGHMGT